MTHSKLSHSLFLAAALAAFAVVGGGCAMNAGEPTTEETPASSEADLRKAPIVTPTTQSTLDEESPSGTAIMPKAAIAPKLITNDHLLGGGQDGDGPRPHPWEPSPESSKNESNSGSSGSSSSTK